MAIIKSGATSDLLTIDPVSKAARVTLYDLDGAYTGKKSTYRASTIVPLVAAVTANTPFFLIEGSGTKTVVIRRIRVSGLSLTAVAYLAVNVAKFSTAASGGTSTAPVAVSTDSAFAAATATVKAYTVAPTAGTLVGTVASARLFGQATVAVGTSLLDQHLFTFGDTPETKGLTLRGTTQGLGLVWPAAPATAVTVAVDIEWFEE